MEDVSPIVASHRYALTIPNDAGLQDHRFLGQAVLPAVHAMEHLARAVGGVFPDVSTTSLANIHFEKFLPLPPSDIAQVDALAELNSSSPGAVEGTLLTRHVAAKSGMTRMKVHARALFGTLRGASGALPKAPAWEGRKADAYQLPADRLYAEMVPFGRSFQNVVSPVWLWPEGAMAIVAGGPPVSEECSLLLGSPFPLDAAFHVACAWAQRYEGVVAFPVAMRQRVIRQRTLPGQGYEACVRSRGSEGDRLLFDLWLHDRAGRLCETVRGLGMRDVSGGKLGPPAWVRAGRSRDIINRGENDALS